jgi:CBS-domain-containing membrane protein
MQAQELMQRRVITVRPTATLAEAARVLLAAGVNSAPVVDEQGRLLGMVGLKDILRAPVPSDHAALVTRYTTLHDRARAVAATRVQAVMARRVVCVDPATPVEEVAALLVNRGRHPIPVLQDGRVAGVIGRSDVVRAILALTSEPAEAPAAG